MWLVVVRFFRKCTLGWVRLPFPSAHTYKMKTPTPKSYNSDDFFPVVGGGEVFQKMSPRLGEAAISLAHTNKMKTLTHKTYNSDHFFPCGWWW